MAKQTNKNNGITRGTKKLITKAIADTQTLNSGVLCDYICAELCGTFSGSSLDYQLNRMKIPTTGAIMDAIDTFIYRHSKNQEVNVSPRNSDSDSE